MYNAYFIQHNPPPCVLGHRPFHYHPVAFQDRCAQVFQIYSNRRLTDPHFQQKMWSISIQPCQYVKLQNAQIKLCFRQQLNACRQKAPLRSCAFVLRLRYCIYMAYQVKYNSCSCEPFRLLPLSLCMHKLIHKQCWHNPIIHPVLTSSTVGCIFSLLDNLFSLFRYALISIYSVEKSSTITALIVIPNTLRLDAPMFYYLWCRTVTAQPDWLMCIPLGQRKTFLKCYTSFHLICNSVICSGMWDDL